MFDESRKKCKIKIHCYNRVKKKIYLYHVYYNEIKCIKFNTKLQIAAVSA